MNKRELLEALNLMMGRIDAAFDEDADKHQADKHLALEEIDAQLAELIRRVEES